MQVQAKLLSLILLALLATACSTEYSAAYQSASAESKWDESKRIIVNDSKQELPLFKVVEDQLYLMIMLKTNDGFFHTETRYPSWDKAEMSRFIEHHPELQSLVPIDWNNWLPRGFGDECKPGAGKQ